MLQAALYSATDTIIALQEPIKIKVTVDEDQSQLDAIAKGDQSAMKNFYHRHGTQVFHFAMKTVKNSEDAAEVLNAVMLEVWKKPNNFQGKSKLSTWLLSITHHKAVDLVRKKSRHDNNDSVDLDIIEGDQSTVLSTMTAEQDGDYIRATVNQLPPIYREVIYLSFYRELSYPEVAEVLSIPVGTVKTRMMNAKKQLKQLLAPAA